MNEQNQSNQQGQQNDGAEAPQVPTAATQRIEATDAQNANVAPPTAATQRIEPQRVIDDSAQRAAYEAPQAQAAQQSPAAQQSTAQPASPAQPTGYAAVLAPADPASQPGVQQAVAGNTAAATQVPADQAHQAAAAQAAPQANPQSAYGYGAQAHNQAQAQVPSQAQHAAQGATTGAAWGQQAPNASPWAQAPQTAPQHQQSNPYGYPNAWTAQAAQSGSGKAPKAPMTPRKRKALRWTAAAGALALAVTLGAVPAWSFGHQAGLNQAQTEAQSQQGNSFGNQNGQSQQDGSGSNGQGSQSNPFGQGTPNDQGGSGSSDGSSDGSNGFQQLPYGYGYGNGSGGSSGTNSSVVEGTKQDSGVDGMVMITTAVSGGEGAGTGMILSADGYVLTNYHVVEASTTVTVTDSTTGKKYTAEVVGRDSTHDVALLKLKDASGLKTVSLASGSVSEGDEVSAVGNASGEGYLRKLTGKVTATKQSITTQSETTGEGEKLSNLIETDADVVPGYSGGAIMNSSGEVVGMTTAASSGNTSETVDGYAIPIQDAITIAEKIKAGESSDTIQIGRGAALGISVLSSDTGQVGGGYGVTVQEVITGGAVAKSGLAAGDTIIGIDNTTVKSYAALKEVLAGHQAGDKVTLTWLNSEGTQKEASVTLGESSVN